MTEQLGGEPQPMPEIEVVPKEVKFYLVRLADLVDLRNHIDRGAFPMSGYEGVPLMPGPVHRDDPSEQPMLYGRGLRWGVLKGIWGTRNALAQLGYGNEADTFLKIMKKQSKIQEQAEGQTGGNL